MKKKIYKYVSVAVIAVAMVVSFQMSRAESATTLTMENIKALALADGEQANICDSIWTVTYSGSVGTSTGVTVECTTGGSYVCPFCFWG